MKAKLKGTNAAPFEVKQIYPEEINGEPTIPFVEYFVDEEGTIFTDEHLDFDIEEKRSVYLKDWLIRLEDDDSIRIVSTANDATVCILPLVSNSVIIKKIMK